MKNSEGIYQFDPKIMMYSAEETNGIVDTAEPFKVEVDKEKMTWTRTEEGMPVKVMLSRADALPKAPADAVQGLWDLTRVLVEKWMLPRKETRRQRPICTSAGTGSMS